MGLLHDYFGNFSTQGERYYFCMEGSMRGEIEMNLRNGRWGGGGGDWNEHWKTQKLGTWVEGVLDLHKSGNELSLDLHKSGKWIKFRLAQVW